MRPEHENVSLTSSSTSARHAPADPVDDAADVGLELVDRKHGGVIVKAVTKGYQAAKTRILRRSFGVYKIDEVDYSQSNSRST